MQFAFLKLPTRRAGASFGIMKQLLRRFRRGSAPPAVPPPAVLPPAVLPPAAQSFEAEFHQNVTLHALWEWEQSRALEKLAVGTQVNISGVHSRQELNGLIGAIVVVDHSQGRCGVRIDGHGDISLKYTCLAPIAAAEEELIHSLEQLGLYDVKQHNPTGRGLPAGPDRWAAMEAARDANTKYRKYLRCFCKVIEERFDAQSGDRLRAWWAAVPDPRPAAAAAFASTTLADVLPLVAEVRGALLQVLRWRVSRGTAHAAHDALRLVRTLALKQLSPANAHVLALFCTGVTTLDLGLGTYGFERFELAHHHAALSGGSHAWRDEQLRGVRRDWVKLHADVLLRLFGSRLQEVDGSNQTWTQQEEPYDELGTAKPLGFFEQNYGVWLHYEADADDPDAVDEAEATVLRRGLTDSGLAHLSGLRKLTLSGCQAVSDAGVCALLRRCPEIVELSLSECTGITDATLSTLAASCPRLSKLSVSRCIPACDDPASHGPQLTVEGVLTLTQSCSELARLTMLGHGELAKDARLVARARELRARGVKVDLRCR